MRLSSLTPPISDFRTSGSLALPAASTVFCSRMFSLPSLKSLNGEDQHRRGMACLPRRRLTSRRRRDKGKHEHCAAKSPDRLNRLIRNCVSSNYLYCSLLVVTLLMVHRCTRPSPQAPGLYDPVADPHAVVILGHARFTVLTSQLVRMEWSADGKFEDHASLVFLNRRLPVPHFTAASLHTSGGEQLLIETLQLKLTCLPNRYRRQIRCEKFCRFNPHSMAPLLPGSRATPIPET